MDYMKLLARTVDTDVVIVPIATLNNVKHDGLCVAFASGHFRLQSKEISAVIDSRKSAILPMFHALTACNTVSSLAGIGKKTMWPTRNVYPKSMTYVNN